MLECQFINIRGPQLLAALENAFPKGQPTLLWKADPREKPQPYQKVDWWVRNQKKRESDKQNIS